MSHFHLIRTRTREITPDYDTYYPRPITHSDSRHQHKLTLSDDSDDGHDDYPYSSSHKPARISRALTLRDQPSTLERYNIWSDRRDTHSDDEDTRRRSFERRRVYKYTTATPTTRCDPEERDFQLNVQAKLTRPRSSHHHHHHHHESNSFWPTDVLRRKEKWVDEDWEVRERSLSRERRRRDSFWGGWEDESEENKESWSRYRRVKSTKTEEVVPLSGWRRERIVRGS
ncbi:hypothetical protein NX059_005771 [Plenodomus lindquistii]|nr:hypothetical protein NX059_005771 [Plenodomus lindquistii]